VERADDYSEPRMVSASPVERPEPRWPAVIAVFAAAALHYSLPPYMRVGPPWLVFGLTTGLALGSMTARHMGWHDVNEWLGHALSAVLTAGLLYAVAMLVRGLIRSDTINHTAAAQDLLRSAALVWVTNIIVFASWYWRIDGGGPNERERRKAHLNDAFLFPQMMVDAQGHPGVTLAEAQQWRPGFVDYLFLAFNSSVAFSPTDVPVLARWAKLMMMVQALISLSTIVLLAGRAVNIL
jgi:hypothetical protein